ncbi:DUF3175 domain-containing protein [Caballeronia sp. LZ062]|uniref:DUF3175 domain-containing protein n=1 Tax=unclassified Caballeronia TaxID=2646786 RepID=UPI002857E945|nr:MULTISPECIES: DUF3175 domain-containing protein [unclassified Caballeronia]MDR5856715.1 DUF3175 domain-containing protein [Caballeronia sp. LZ050]MDR5869888.1 DUF3175 domain-containing protein [Caballeronia sp. LZ062]
MATDSKSKKTGTGAGKTRAGKSTSTRQRHALASNQKKTKSKSANSADSTHRWSHHVMETSDAMDLQRDIFKNGNAEEIAQSLKRSSTESTRRKGTPFQSAMSMLNFYINRAGRNLPKTRRNTLERAKKHLREAFGRKP